MTRLRLALLAVLILSIACTQAGPGPSSETPAGSGGKTDSAWLSNDTFEVEVRLSGSITHQVGYEFPDVAAETASQLRLIDTQVKFAKNEMAAHGYHVNQLVDQVRVAEVSTDGETVTVGYEVSLDMVHELSGDTAPSFNDLGRTRFQVTLPVDPVGVFGRVEGRCANDEDVREDNYYYYFDPDKKDCDLETYEASLNIIKVFERRTAYPEYDQLQRDMGDGKRGFTAAWLPDTGDSDSLSIFDDLKYDLEEELAIEGARSEDGEYVRFNWVDGDIKVVIDLFDPTKNWHGSAFKAALGSYNFVVYDGHSSYGTLDLLTDPETFSDDYQIVLMDSCRSYEYYTRRVFRAKASSDPQASEDARRGWDKADVVASVGSPTFGYSGNAPREVLRGLMDGLQSIEAGHPERAPTWVSIMSNVNSATGNFVHFGVAGARTNAWQP